MFYFYFDITVFYPWECMRGVVSLELPGESVWKAFIFPRDISVCTRLTYIYFVLVCIFSLFVCLFVFQKHISVCTRLTWVYFIHFVFVPLLPCLCVCLFVCLFVCLSLEETPLCLQGCLGTWARSYMPKYLHELH